MKDLGRCVALDNDGKRCLKRATGHVKYHGEHELVEFSERAQWVVAAFCEPNFQPWLTLNGSSARTTGGPK